MLIFIISVVAR